jgi:hypothetical protein
VKLGLVQRSELLMTYEEAAKAVKMYGNNVAAAKALGVSEFTIRRWLKRKPETETTTASVSVSYPLHPEDDIPVEEIISLMARRFSKRREYVDSKTSQIVKIDSSTPVVIALVGDPHLDDDGCDWPRLLADIELMKQPHVYAVNIGDTTNNWLDKLAHLYAKQETSLKTARKLIKWFLTESGIRWLVWVMGNHDLWASGSDIIRGMNTNQIVIDDWSARFTVEFKNGTKVPFWVSHDFPGTSQWNRMHGLMKAALMRGGAAVYACGHRHVAGIHWEPLEDQNTSYWALRCKGYKSIDSHAVRMGYGATDDGHTVAVVIDPRQSDHREMIQGFKSLRAAVTYRNALG